MTEPVSVPIPQELEPEFRAFPKIARLSRDAVITEKIDGTNGVIYISDVGEIRAGSRNRWLAPGKGDNFGFAAWVAQEQDVLRELGPGYHHGEWWGYGIQRGYGLTEKRFSLFNPKHYGWAAEAREAGVTVYTTPVLYVGRFSLDDVEYQLIRLREHGSVAAPGFMQPEGVVVFHTASRTLFKKTIEKDSTGKEE